ncbi:MAG TPA: glycoside hydrolase family 13 [Chloroflexus aurantiacus]|jgi:1,4-alpha-glucan branching enzyme|uniref:Glycoside hydrolase family 13 domain protein n=1 Tax=Chloroflexus aurantiacus (strain ATCC 29366 / DSM 635 / J-10-fl) TaxID=324602 RepID=A9WIG4_CHLAA|nr:MULTISPECIES: isoamylase early set domain-containing protein [Chloroflexus]ABY34264.1 glycoside hydrolase family 13 domain protein [Chloroflexus aurantiacus J-10-fl]RMG50208.1 MAG: glycoside hydrolase family 13 [Chloroflexota bacterium]HBW68499.1 glycoside hydrolase family 13 [Chloroflexus aurantiacus]
MIAKQPGPAGKVRVTFSLPASLWADTIYLVGDFNGWNPHATPLRATEHGWMITLDLEAGRTYQYRYLVNGNEWHNDWNADGYAPNPYGGNNSVVETNIFADPVPRAERVVGSVQSVKSFPPRLRLVSNG